MKLCNKVAIAGAVAIIANYCWNWWKKGNKDEEKKEGTPNENDNEEISIVPASEAIPLMPESVSLKKENNVKANPMIMPGSELLKEAVKEIPLAPRFIIDCKEEKPQRGIYRFDVDEIGQVDALIDTGATACIVRINVLADSMKSKIIKPSTAAKVLKLFDGISKMDILGYVFLRVSYLNNKNVKLPFLVVDESCNLPMILGNNWIRKSRAVLQTDGTKLAVTFGGKEERMEARFSFSYNCYSPKVSVYVDGIDKEKKAMVDSGSKSSFIRSDILTEPQKEKAIPTSDRSTMANNAELKGVEKIIRLKITFGGNITWISSSVIV